MTTLAELHDYCAQKSRQYPNYSEEINETYQLALSEVEAGESLINEIDHCVQTIEDLIEDDDEEDLYCGSCNGTGISPTGPVDSNCSSCGGSGTYTPPQDDDYDPFDYHEKGDV